MSEPKYSELLYVKFVDLFEKVCYGIFAGFPLLLSTHSDSSWGDSTTRANDSSFMTPGSLSTSLNNSSFITPGSNRNTSVAYSYRSTVIHPNYQDTDTWLFFP